MAEILKRSLARFVVRHRVGIQDLSFVLLVLLVAGYFLYTYDILVAPGALRS
jgi:hypothetical protein